MKVYPHISNWWAWAGLLVSCFMLAVALGMIIRKWGP